MRWSPRSLTAPGTRFAASEADDRRIRLTNVSALIGTVVNYTYLVGYALLGWWPLVAFNALGGLAYPATLWLNARGHTRLAPFVLLAAVVIQCTIVPCVFLGPATGIHYFQLVVTPFTFMLLHRRDVYWVILLSAASIGGFLFTEYAPPPLATAIDVSHLAARRLHISSTTSTILIIVLIVYLFYSGLERAQARLRAAKEAAEATSEQLRQDLQAAAQVQAALLPSRAPETDRARFAWAYRPSAALGGDLLNVFALDDRHIGMYVLDASGHGVQAALLSVAVSRSLSPRADRSSIVLLADGDGLPPTPVRPQDVARHLSALYPFDGPTAQFMTLVYAVLDTHTGDCRYICAGHPAPLLLRAGGEARFLHAPALPIGLSPDPDYHDQLIQLAPGDRLYLYSDGLEEQPNPARELFGPDRIRSHAARAQRDPLDRAVHTLLDTVHAWAAGRPLRDDISILAVEFMKA